MRNAVELTVPGDKSISHRALMLAALADGESRIRGLLDSADTRATAAALRALGAQVPELERGASEVVVHGQPSLSSPAEPLDCGNSGTTARLLMGVAAGAGIAVEFTGDESLRARPMRRVTEPLAAMGARIDELGAPDRLPLRIVGGALKPLQHTSLVASAQVKSALLLAGLIAGVEVSVMEPSLSRDHTERLLEALGFRLQRAVAAAGLTVSLRPQGKVRPFELDVPGDFSSAAFMLAAGVLGGRPIRVREVGVNPTRTGLLHVLERMGGDIVVADRAERGGEPVASITATPSSLRATTIDGDEVPALIDELPLFAMLAARAQGESVVRGAAELRVKETDRIRAVVENLRAIGVDVDEAPDGFVVRGTDAPLRGTVRTWGDHRIAMAFGVLAATTEHQVVIDDPRAVDVSFPGFWDRLALADGTPSGR